MFQVILSYMQPQLIMVLKNKNCCAKQCMYRSSNQKINLALAKSKMYFCTIPDITSDTKMEFQFSILLVNGKEHQNSST